ncbi:hypothetical protein D3C79_908030 [compost metagenome]
MVQLDPGELQRGRLDVGALERLHPVEVGVLGEQEALFVHADGDSGNFQQGIGSAVEAAGFNIYHYRQIAAEALGHRVARAAAALGVQVVFVEVFAHAFSSSRRQRSFSPARSGTTVCSPNGRLSGAVHSSRTRVMVSVFAGRP